MNIANFTVNQDKCIGCGKCVKVCPGGILYVDGSGKSKMKPITEFGWNGCWKCEHCLAVCPTAAISVLDHQPEDSPLPESNEVTRKVLDSLIANRHSCRRYLDKNVSRDVIKEMLNMLANAPNGGNKQQVEFTLIDDKEQMKHFRKTAYDEMERLAKEEIYPSGFDKASYQQISYQRGVQKTIEENRIHRPLTERRNNK